MNNTAEQSSLPLRSTRAVVDASSVDTDAPLPHLRSTLRIAAGSAAAAALPALAVTGSALTGALIAVAMLGGVSLAGLLI